MVGGGEEGVEVLDGGGWGDYRGQGVYRFYGVGVIDSSYGGGQLGEGGGPGADGVQGGETGGGGHLAGGVPDSQGGKYYWKVMEAASR